MATAGGRDLALLQLGYFRRYQLDTQIAYYKWVRKRHEATARRTLAVGAAAVALDTASTGISGVIGAWTKEFGGFAALGVISIAAAAYATNREGIGQNRRHAERFERTLDALYELRATLDGVRLAVANGSRESLEQFVEAVHEQISVEHRQWLECGERTEKSVKRLHAILKEQEAARTDDQP